MDSYLYFGEWLCYNYVCVIVAYVNVSVRLSKLDLLPRVHLLFSAYFGMAHDFIALDQVQCTGDEFELAEVVMAPGECTTALIWGFLHK